MRLKLVSLDYSSASYHHIFKYLDLNVDDTTIRDVFSTVWNTPQQLIQLEMIRYFHLEKVIRTKFFMTRVQNDAKSPL